MALLALTAGIMRPASTDPILTETGTPLAGSVAELIRVPIGGHDQAMMIRGTSTDNPVLLFLAGGPGGTELGAMRRHGQALEKDFVVVTWDQRGTGKSYDSLDPTSTLTLQQAVNDTIEVSNYLRNRFGQDKIYHLRRRRAHPAESNAARFRRGRRCRHEAPSRRPWSLPPHAPPEIPLA